MFAARSRLIDLWDRVRSSYWFIPSLMFFGAVLLALGMARLDIFFVRGEVLPDWFPKFDGEAARSILSTIASGMITVTGVVFSLTIVSLQLASSQFGPRLLRAFMSSLGNQIVLGTFTATFIYSLIVVGTVRDSDFFVPQLSTLVGIFLGIIGIAVLIYFIHHVATSIRIENLIETVAGELRKVSDDMFPLEIGEGSTALARKEGDPFPPDGDFAEVRADGAGYIRRIDGDMLMAAACEHDLVLRVIQKPGDFLVYREVLFHASPAAKITPEVEERLRDSVVLGSDRTPTQDIAFAIGLLVEVAQRALSPGINDPFTAIECANRLAEGLCRIICRPRPSPYRLDSSGTLRVIAEPLSIEDMTHKAFDPIARAGGGNGDVAGRLLELVLTIASCAVDPRDRRFMIGFAHALHDQFKGQLSLERDRHAVAERFEAALARLAQHAQQRLEAPAEPI